MAVYGIKHKYRIGGGQPEVRNYAEGTSETFKSGQPVVWDRSEEGLVLASVGTVTFTGIALKDASGTAGTVIPVLIPSAEDVFEATISDDGANSAAVHDDVWVNRLVGWKASTESGQTTKITVDSNNTSNDWIKITDIYTDALEPAGTAGGRVLFRFIGAAIDGESIA